MALEATAVASYRSKEISGAMLHRIVETYLW